MDEAGRPCALSGQRDLYWHWRISCRSIGKSACNSRNCHAKIAALEAGIGLAAFPKRLTPSSLIQANEYYLPQLPTVRAQLCARRDLDIPKATIL